LTDYWWWWWWFTQTSPSTSSSQTPWICILPVKRQTKFYP